MRKLSVFNTVSLDGYFTDANGDMSWAHQGGADPEFADFTSGNSSGDSVLVFGRVTYDLMAAFWPTPGAAQAMPAVAQGMNRMEKIVFSRSRDRLDWANCQLVREHPAIAMAAIKRQAGPDLTILGSGSIIARLADAGLIDSYQIVVAPIVLGGGRSMFAGIGRRLDLKLASSRAFGNGKVVLSYETA